MIKRKKRRHIVYAKGDQARNRTRAPKMEDKAASTKLLPINYCHTEFQKNITTRYIKQQNKPYIGIF